MLSKWFPTIVQVTGLLIVIFGVIFWAVTNRESALIIGAGLSMFGIGEFRRIQVVLTDNKDSEKPNGNSRSRTRR